MRDAAYPLLQDAWSAWLARRLRGGLRQGRRGRDPEADEHSQRLDGDADVARWIERFTPDFVLAGHVHQVIQRGIGVALAQLLGALADQR